jgi:hypothetical protein
MVPARTAPQFPRPSGPPTATPSPDAPRPTPSRLMLTSDPPTASQSPVDSGSNSRVDFLHESTESSRGFTSASCSLQPFRCGWRCMPASPPSASGRLRCTDTKSSFFVHRAISSLDNTSSLTRPGRANLRPTPIPTSRRRTRSPGRSDPFYSSHDTSFTQFITIRTHQSAGARIHDLEFLSIE